MTTTDLISTINRIADNSSELQIVAALREAQTALMRLEAIRRAHHKYETRTDGGTQVWPSISGNEMHRLLYGDLDGN
jgi:hypothetical protein